ncbi:hypothetical protein PZ938_03050 [Luteipulveratus sp. YIM 133132]|uniref:hypothetical protein n=1 Tax=Luteipulveratus flavus TaxID=3031728 RepID=UPI0023AF6E73|nr:hypothetical protein [Luteipulveratus sp. YIM 133132]MDE9364570.1 hypothetical protein [Luteipulveratus sp. YIM 133132]
MVFALARAFAEVFFDAHASDEQVALFLDDADAVVDDFDPPPSAWDVRQVQTDELGVAIGLTINDREYVLPETEQEPEVPVALSTWREWHREND